MTDLPFHHRACPRAESELALLVEQFSPDRAMILRREDAAWISLAHHPRDNSAEEVHRALSAEALQHIVETGEAKIFASPSPDVEPLVALMGGVLDVVMVSRSSQGPEHRIIYLARSLQKGLYKDEDLRLLEGGHAPGL